MPTIALAGIELFGHHGVDEEERSRGQRFIVDVDYDVGPEAASDELERTVDYRAVVACLQEVFEARRYRLLEALATAIADALVERFGVERVRVRVRKPDVRLALPLEHSAVSVERRAPSR